MKAITNRILGTSTQPFIQLVGVQTQIETHDKVKVKSLSYCSPCKSIQSSIAGYCCKCGHRSIPLKHKH